MHAIMDILNQLVYARLMPAQLSAHPAGLPGLIGELRASKLRITARLLELDRQTDNPASAIAIRRYQLQFVAVVDVLHFFQLQAGPRFQEFYDEAAALVM